MKALRLSILTLATIASSLFVSAQEDVMHIFLKDGSVVDYKVSEIKDITFETVDDDIPMPVGEAVDLELSVKWANMNLGAETPTDNGAYFAWGETKPKGSFSEVNCQWFGVTLEELQTQGVINADGNLTSQYDAATVRWGEAWRMPTLEEVTELLTKCTWAWTESDGICGYTVTGPNGNSIFLAAAGYRSGEDLKGTGEDGCYWGSKASGDVNACSLDFKSYDRDLYYYNRAHGQTIRPVAK